MTSAVIPRMAIRTTNQTFEMEELATIQNERKNVTFDVEKMKAFLEGSPEKLEKMNLAFQIIERDPYLYKENFYDLTKQENLEKTIIQMRRYAEVRATLIKDKLLAESFETAIQYYDRSLGMKVYVHVLLFIETIMGQGTTEQFEFWEPLVRNFCVLGCFAMTELGHSSHLRGLETTATYDHDSREFVIHSPTTTSTKWWIGMAGLTATHTVVFAKLIVNGRAHGPHWFIVKLRDEETGKLAPGVSAGSIGPKSGRDGLDNGWIQFSQVRVPYSNFLSKWSKIDIHGTYSPPFSVALGYLTLIGERVLALPGVVSQICQTVTIAVRYSLIRRQGEKNQQIIDYQSHYYYLMPIISYCYVFRVVSKFFRESWDTTMKMQSDPKQRMLFFNLVQDFHAQAACLKTHAGWWGTTALEHCRRSGGGHFYSQYNAIAGHIGDYAVLTTGGGDNNVLVQQHCSYLISSYRKVLKGQEVFGSATFLKNYNETLKKTKLNANNMNDLSDCVSIVDAFEWISIRLLSELVKKIDRSKAEENIIEMINVSQAYFYYFMLKSFLNLRDTFPTELVSTLDRLVLCFALQGMNELMGHFLEYNFVSHDQVQMIRATHIQVCREIRKDSVGLVDSFNLPDFVIKSPLGKYEPSYQDYFNMVKKSPGISDDFWAKEVKLCKL